jgi:L-alanine-DL-glutamate epimerase-like enolase superfamily enzyme
MSLVIVQPETAAAGSLFKFEIVWHLLTGHVSLITLKIEAKEEIWPLKEVLRISRGSRTETRVVVVTVRDGEHVGRGEGVPIARYNQSCASVIEQIEPIKREKNLDRQLLQNLLPAGAARNALDCALWDLEAKRSSKRVWELANFQMPYCSLRPVGDAHASHSEAATSNPCDLDFVETSFTISLDNPEKMAAAAKRYFESPRARGEPPGPLKLKLYGSDDVDLARVRAVREVAPAARLIIDTNESWSVEQYRQIAPPLKELGVAMIEQPFPVDADDVLQTLDHPIPICADESCHTTADLPCLKNRYEVINVKLDKTGGLTEALQLCQRARENDFKLLIGCMVCTSLSIAPARLLASNADWVDLDGPLLLAKDREHGLYYYNGRVGIPSRELWG